MSRTPAASLLDLARTVLRTEAAAILRLVDTIDGDFERAIEALFECRGRVDRDRDGQVRDHLPQDRRDALEHRDARVLPAPAEAIHGDLGALRDDDVVIAMSRSGETEEVIRLLESIRRIGARLIAITGEPRVDAGEGRGRHADCGIAEEACPFNLAPTASTTAALALGDALAMTLLVRKGFREEDFASLHPGGRLGRRLMRVEQAMHAGDAAPLVRESTLMPDIFHEMSSKRSA